MTLQPFVGPWFLLQFHSLLYTDGRTPWTGDQPVTMPVLTHRTTQTQNKRTHTAMPWEGFESTIPVSERSKTVHSLDRAAIVIGSLNKLQIEITATLACSACIYVWRNVYLRDFVSCASDHYAAEVLQTDAPCIFKCAQWITWRLIAWHHSSNTMPLPVMFLSMRKEVACGLLVSNSIKTFCEW
jgi:hypothetical protein